MFKYLFFGISIILLGLGILYNFYDILTYFKEISANLKSFSFFVVLIIFLLALNYLINYHKKNEVIKLKDRLKTWSKISYHVTQVGDEVFNELPIGIIAIEDNIVKWSNLYTQTIFNKKIIDLEIEELNEDIFNMINDNVTNDVIKIDENYYDVIYKSEYKFIYLFESTKRELLLNKYKENMPVLGILYLDNFDESMVNLDVSEESTIKSEYLAAISDWAVKYESYLKPYDNERLLLVTHRKNLDKMIDDKFSVLDQIRNISAKNEIRITLSIGLASWDVSFEDLGILAQNTIELAEKRGGDQVVVNIENEKISYFGAKTDTKTKASRVGTRINAQTIFEILEKAKDIIIMGHDDADADSIGSMLGAYHMAKTVDKPIYLIIDEEKLDRTVLKIFSIVDDKKPESFNHFVTTEEALEVISKETVLIIVDTQTPKIIMSPELLDKGAKTIVIDHHRASEVSFDAIFSYVDPSASSTIEIILELLNFFPEESMEFNQVEASIMYAGLVLDTNNFGYRTSAKTFEAAQLLKEKGISTTEVKSWLRRDIDTIRKINKLVSTIDIFMDRFAFVVTDDVLDDRILIAQVTDEALQISGVDASFTIGYLPNGKVGVSARSFEKVNVQILMEALGGGGHINSAATQISNKTVHEVSKELKEYLELEYGSGGEEVKIILLEEVRGRGKKDEVIDVTNGYGQFLINQKKAILATPENISILEKKKEDELESQIKQVEMLKKIKEEIDNKKISVQVQLGRDGKMFGSVTTKQITELFEEEYGIQIDRKKLEISSEITSLGIYTATVNLHKDIKAQFEVQIIEK